MASELAVHGQTLPPVAAKLLVGNAGPEAGSDRFWRAVSTEGGIERVAGGDAQNPPESGVRGFGCQSFEGVGGAQASLRTRGFVIPDHLPFRGGRWTNVAAIPAKACVFQSGEEKLWEFKLPPDFGN